MPATPRANKRIRIEVPDSPQSSVTEFFSPLSTLSFQNLLKSPENTVTTPQTIANVIPNTPSLSKVAFQNPYNIINNARTPSSSPLSSPPLSPLQLPAMPKEPLRPLHHERIEMAYLRYQQEKEKWLKDHPAIRPSEYCKAQGFKRLMTKEIQECERFLPEERRKPSGELIEKKTKWLEEEIFAWSLYQEQLEDDMFRKNLQDWEISGFQQYEGINIAMEHIGNEIEKERESYTM